MNLAQKIKVVSENMTTYRAGLLQTKAYRILKHCTEEILSEFDITSVEWAFLGLLHDTPRGMRSGAMADELGVEAPFVTQIVQKLNKAELITNDTDPDDSRARVLALSKSGRMFVDKVERHLRIEMKPLLKNVLLPDLIGYLSVMQTIIDNNCEPVVTIK